MYPVKVGTLRISAKSQPFFIAGPCVIESEKHCLKMAERLAEQAATIENRSDIQGFLRQGKPHILKSFRGPGLEEGLRILQKARDASADCRS